MDRRNYVRSSAWRTEGVVENDDSDEVEDGGVDSDDDDDDDTAIISIITNLWR